MKNRIRDVKMMLLVISGVLVCSCQQKIDLNLKSSQPQLVIEGVVSDQLGFYIVGLTKSKVYDDDNTPVFVVDADVQISDDAGNIDTLTQVATGIYTSQPKNGIPGRTYTLSVKQDGKLYQATSTMPQPVAIDSVYYVELAGFGSPEKLSKRPYCIINDPAGIVNYYVVKTTVNSKLDGGVRVYSDRLWDGKPRDIRAPGNDLQAGDTVTIEVRSVDKPVFDYFYELNQNTSSINQPAAPANPSTNISPKTLGYFSAQAVAKKTDIVK